MYQYANEMCYFCSVPYGPPFPEHTASPEGQKRSPNDCPYGDIVKPIAYLIYTIPEVRALVMSAMNLPNDHFPNLAAYAEWLGKRNISVVDALINVHEVIVHYMAIREDCLHFFDRT